MASGGSRLPSLAVRKEGWAPCPPGCGLPDNAFGRCFSLTRQFASAVHVSIMQRSTMGFCPWFAILVPLGHGSEHD